MKDDAVKKYLTSSMQLPYFLFVSDTIYKSVLGELAMIVPEFELVRVSRFCSESDKLPDIDGLLEYLRTAKGKSIVVVGLGEYLALRGSDEAARVLSQLKDMSLADTKVVLLLRGLGGQISWLKSDPRFDARRYSVADLAYCDLSFALVLPNIGMADISGLRALLVALEDGAYGKLSVSTHISFDSPLCSATKVESAYDWIAFTVRGFDLPRNLGSDEHWAKLLHELDSGKSTLDAAFARQGFISNLEKDFYNRITGSAYRNWFYFVALKINAHALENGYLRFALGQTDCFSTLVENILHAIISISHKDECFGRFYQERKLLIEKFPESDIASFVVNNREGITESIYRLTDTTSVEREEIIAWVSENGIVPQLEYIYPALAAYLKKYVFKRIELAGFLTDYFEAYKLQKISNNLQPAFLERVDEIARTRKYNRLPTRNEVLDKVDKSGAYLYWLDALGVEYLALIEQLAQNKGLAIDISIARAKLPTITSINRDFYDDWPGGAKEKNSHLDDTKHKDAGGYKFTDNKLPIHLAKEIEIISDVIARAATSLKLRTCDRFVIASDHGASRLAVLRNKEEKYETDTKGEHSGRCCKKPPHPYDLPFVAEENGYLVLADYGRFRGSRRANVELHGGATLEEVIVPIIVLTLKNNNITVKLVDEAVTVDFRTGAEVRLFINAKVSDVSIIVSGNSYTATPVDAHHHIVKLPDIKRAGKYPADVYAGDDPIGTVQIKAQAKSAKINDDFDF